LPVFAASHDPKTPLQQSTNGERTSMPEILEHEKHHTVGVISDTHGLLRPGVIEALRGVELIIHAGDIGTRQVIEALSAIAPVVAVRGNMDGGEWSRNLRDSEVVEVGRVLIYVLHDIQALDLDPAAVGFSAVISGHSHRPSATRRKGVLYLNPGSAGPRRFKLPVSLAFLKIKKQTLDARFVQFET